MAHQVFIPDGYAKRPPVLPPEADRAKIVHRPSLHASFHVAGVRGMLFDSGAQKLYAINRSASLIWCCLAEGYTPSQIANIIARRAGISPAEAERQVDAAFRAWRGLGIVGTAPLLGTVQKNGVQSAAVACDPRPAGRATSSRTPFETCCRVLDTNFGLAFEQAAVRDALLRLTAAFEGRKPRLGDERLDIVACGPARVDLRHNGTLRWSGPVGELAPVLLATLVRLALERSETYPAIHAAAVATTRGAVLFPGASGAGKSTLTAALHATGYKVLCDDTVVLDRSSMRIRPVAPLLCLKSGSWPAIRRYMPCIDTAPAYRRPDGAIVRLLPLDRPGVDRGTSRPHGLPVHAIVFPRYRPGHATRLVPMRRTAALNRIAPCIDPLGRPLDAADIEGVINWVAGLECYALSVGTLDDAARALTDILG